MDQVEKTNKRNMSIAPGNSNAGAALGINKFFSSMGGVESQNDDMEEKETHAEKLAREYAEKA